MNNEELKGIIDAIPTCVSSANLTASDKLEIAKSILKTLSSRAEKSKPEYQVEHLLENLSIENGEIILTKVFSGSGKKYKKCCALVNER